MLMSVSILCCVVSTTENEKFMCELLHIPSPHRHYIEERCSHFNLNFSPALPMNMSRALLFFFQGHLNKNRGGVPEKKLCERNEWTEARKSIIKIFASHCHSRPIVIKSFCCFPRACNLVYQSLQTIHKLTIYN